MNHRGVSWMLAGMIALGAGGYQPAPIHVWTPEEVKQVAVLWLGSVPAMKPDPSNIYADDAESAALGARLFRDPRFSHDTRLSCASCHQPEKVFTDGLEVSHGICIGSRNTPSVVLSSFGNWFTWDGRKDSQWAQALGPTENASEMGGTRSQCARVVLTYYRAEYEQIFGPADLDLHLIPRSASPLGGPDERAEWRKLDYGVRDKMCPIGKRA